MSRVWTWLAVVLIILVIAIIVVACVAAANAKWWQTHYQRRDSSSSSSSSSFVTGDTGVSSSSSAETGLTGDSSDILSSAIASTAASSANTTVEANALANYAQIEPVLRAIDGTNRSRRSNPRVKRSMSGDIQFTASSTNWSGYVTATSLTSPASNAVTAVSGSWTVPSVTATPGISGTYCAIWVGLDGFSDGTVEQLGTEQDVINGHVESYAWIEMYPGGAYEIVGFPVNPGDSISAAVTHVSGSTFALQMSNNTRHVYVTIPSSYTRLSGAHLSSAEWVVEAPYENGVLPLAHFSTVTFTNCAATVNGVSGPISACGAQNEPINMVSSNGSHIKAQTSSLNSAGNSFSVAWVSST